MPAFLAFLDHIHSMLTTTYHNTPIVLMASPQWTRDCIETITQFVFERTKTPSLCMIHSAIATQYGLRWPNMTVVDIGFEKVDVTCIYDGSVVNHRAIGVPYSENDEGILSGGEVFTRKLLELLGDKDFDYDKAEQLKKSSICEVLPYNPEFPERMELPKENADTTGFALSGNPGADMDKAGEKAGEAAPEDGAEDVDKSAEDGVLDVASIVTSGQTKEFLAKKEKDKGKPGKKGKEGQTESQAARIARLPNSKRTHNVFHHEVVVQEEVPKPKPAPPAAPAAAPVEAAATAENGAANGAAKPEVPEGEKPAAEEPAKEGDDAMKVDAPEPAEKPADDKPAEEKPAEEKPAEEKPKETEGEAQPSAPAPAPAAPTEPAQLRAESPVETELQSRIIRNEIEVGLERFLFADRAQIDRITTAIFKTIQGIPDMYMRPACWDSIAVVGNGSRIRGLRENIIQTLTARHLVSPSSATMFTSELPSNMATPIGTGSQTPTGSFVGTPHQMPTSAPGVNPLLQAATTAGLNAQSAAGSEAAAAAAGAVSTHRFHSQTPTSIKLATLPSYLGEWTKSGFEEAMFLGALVAGRMAFCLHNLDVTGAEAQRKMSLSRVEYK